MSDHISRRELKQDKIHDAIEHGAEAFYLHKQVTLGVLLVILAGAIAYGSWTVYHDRQTATATVDLDSAMKAYNGRIGGQPDPQQTTVGQPRQAGHDMVKRPGVGPGDASGGRLVERRDQASQVVAPAEAGCSQVGAVGSSPCRTFWTVASSG